MKSLTFTAIILSATILCLLLGCAKKKSVDEVMTPTTVVNLREGPSTKHAIILSIQPGETLKVIDKDFEDWTHVLTTAGEEGYIASDYLIVSNESFIETPRILSEFEQNIKESQERYEHKITLQHWSAYIILGGLIILILCNLCGWELPKIGALLVMGISEIILAYSTTGDSLPWFCEPNRVGWIWTCIDFLLFILLIKCQQAEVKNILNSTNLSIWARLGIYPLTIIGALGVLAAIKGVNIPVSIGIFAIGLGLLYLIVGKWYDTPLQRVMISCFLILTRGALLLLMLQNLCLLIIGGIALWIFKGIGEDNSRTGKKYIKLSDGYTILDVTNSSCYAYDQNGHPWEKDNVSGEWHRA